MAAFKRPARLWRCLNPAQLRFDERLPLNRVLVVDDSTLDKPDA